ncbi:MAG TPA: FxLYD domain-containing protein [Bryobacteraceae bacterium]|nr:FxLYD domain-containing protein [Bryobacteraceae bacterium]
MAPKKESRISIPILLVFMLAVAGLGLWWFLASRPRQAQTPAAITAEAKTYVRNLKLGDVEMKATENFAGAAVIEILGRITNGGTRTLNRVELNCVFYDPYGQELKRERVPIVRTTLAPGQTRSFRLPFEGIPQGWNQALPSLVIASIQFAE